MLDLVKLALRISTDAFDDELEMLIRAVITYVKAHFGEPDDYDRLKKSYDEQKAQLITASGYGMR